jgi:photosystem II stability/assembly factor-like uncharacterized protein
VDGGVVQQSIDGGATWATQYTLDAGTALVAGAAPSSSICWFVGDAGAVFVTADGRAWRRAPFPEATHLIAVTATDARNAEVVTADKRVFVTTDGGQRWVLRRN